MYNFTNPEKGMHYLSEWLDELPANVVISKGLTGCGATTLAIDQPKDTIIAVPYTALITNKIPKHKDILLGLFGPTLDRFKSVISDYLSTHTRIKIMTTYDSLPKVCATLMALGHSPYEDMHLVIDEWHLLFASLGFREDAKKGGSSGKCIDGDRKIARKSWQMIIFERTTNQGYHAYQLYVPGTRSARPGVHQDTIRR